MIDNAVAIICSRPESKRFPGKVFKKVAGHKALMHIITRIHGKIRYVIGIPSKTELIYHHELYEHTKELGDMHFYVGSDDSPLHRMAAIASSMNDIKWIIRITHDDILIDGQTMLDLIAECEKQDAGYGITPGIVEGAGVEVIRRENLVAAAERHKEPTEYVSYFVQGEGLPYPKIVRMEPRESIRRSYRLTMDYPEDAQVLDIVLRQVGPFASTDKVCQFIDCHPYVMNLNRQPELTIYTCAYNAEKYIRQTMESVLSNVHIDYEYIVIDDSSRDKTPLIISEFSHEKRLKIILNDSNLGLASSSNIALSQARGKYIMRLDADDILISNWLGDLLAKIKDSKAAAIYPAYLEMDEDGTVKGQAKILGNVHHHAGCALMDKRILNEIRFKDGIRHWDGLDLYKRLTKRCHVDFSDIPTWLYRQHPKSMSKNDLDVRHKLKDQINARP